ncbi:MAG: fumarylacetoacetate hydrolase family protein [Caldilineaceae bacterium]|nr:fumarylacetoacetate hydrolase family protein [Caldilineaceae bacterium]
MKLLSFSDGGESRLGVLQDDGSIADVCKADAEIPTTIKGLFAAGSDAMDRVKAAAAGISTENVLNRSGVDIGPPIPDPGKILCIGINYKDHIEETNSETPEFPVVFAKYANTIVGPEADVQLPTYSTKVDYEAEFAVVIGKTARNVAMEDALDHVGGYTCLNDVSARDLQQRTSQWVMGKSPDTFAPIGPVVVTSDDVPDPHSLDIKLRLNGETMQSSNTKHLLFRVEDLIADIARVITLDPGDIISTGTPGGVGAAREPAVFLKPGDSMEVEISSIGILRNGVVQGL